jgi:hypothetical protein
MLVMRQLTCVSRRSSFAFSIMRAQLVAHLLGGFVFESIQPRIMLTQPAEASTAGPSASKIGACHRLKMLIGLEDAHVDT